MLNQQEIADHLDLSQPTTSQWLERLGIDWKTSSLDAIRIAYIRALREQAAGRAAAGDLDLATERARLAREQADKVAMQNGVARGELAPVILIEEVLTKAAGRAAAIFDAIPGMVRRRVPRLTTEELDLIAAEIARARNAVASMSLADVAPDEETDGDTAVIEGAA